MGSVHILILTCFTPCLSNNAFMLGSSSKGFLLMSLIAKKNLCAQLPLRFAQITIRTVTEIEELHASSQRIFLHSNWSRVAALDVGFRLGIRPLEGGLGHVVSRLRDNRHHQGCYPFGFSFLARGTGFNWG